MNGGFRQNRRFALLLLAVSLLHAALLLVPAVRQTVTDGAPAPVVAIRLQPAAPPKPAEEAEPAPRPEPRRETTETPPRAVARAPAVKTPPPPEPEPPEHEPPEPEVSGAAPPALTAHRILSELAAARERDPLAGTERRAQLQAFRPSLDEVLNEPSVQLPFRDRRIYLVDSYGPGIGGSVERFFDRATVPFAYQTKYNTRIQCAWILIIAGCSWGDASLYYAADRARKRTPGEG